MLSPPRTRTRTLSRAEVSALCGCAVILLLHAVPSAPALLEYRAVLWLIEPWRLIGAHVVHINWPHVLVNCAAWWLVVRLFERELGPGRQWLAFACGALAIDAGLALLYPAIAWYRGASGVLHSLFFAGAVLALLAPAGDRGGSGLVGRFQGGWRARWLPAVLVVGGAVKVLLEQPRAADTPFAEWLGAGTVPQAHWLGAVAGALLGAVLAWRARSSGKESAAAARGV